MSADSNQQRKYFWFAPMVNDSGGNSTAAAIATSTTVAVLDLFSLPLLPAAASQDQKSLRQNVLGCFITLQAETVDAYVVFGPTAASVSGANAPVATTTSIISAAGVLTLGKGLALYIPATQERRYILREGSNQAAQGQAQGSQSLERFLGVVTKASTGILRVWGSSMP